MGMLGALAGAGKGLMDYSTLLNHKADLDWQAQQSAIQFERQKSLQDAQLASQQKIASEGNQTQRDVAAGHDATSLTGIGMQTTSQEGISAAHNASQERIGAATNATTLANGAQQVQGHLAGIVLQGQNQIGYVNAMGAQQRATSAFNESLEVQKASELADLSLEMDSKKKAQKLTELRSSDMFKNASDSQKQLMETAISEPEVAKTVLDVQKLYQREVPMDQARLAIDDGVKAYNELDDKNKAIVKKQLESTLGYSVTDAQAAQLAGKQRLTMLMEQTGKNPQGQPGMPTMQSLGPQQLDYNPQVDIPKFQQMSSQQQDVWLNNLKASNPEMYRRFSADLAQATNAPKGATSSSPGMLSRLGGAVGSYATRNVDPASENSIRAANPKSPYETQMAYDLRIQNLMNKR